MKPSSLGLFSGLLRRAKPVCRGASLIEVAVILPILLVLIFVIVEMAHFWGIRNVVDQGVQRGINLAAKIPDLEKKLTKPLNVSDEDTKDFIKARSAVIDEATKLPLATLVHDLTATGSTAHFVGFDKYPYWETDHINPTKQVNAVVLRPGECVGDLDGVLHCHPTVCPNDVDPSQCTGRPIGTDKIADLLTTEPVVVSMPVSFRPLLPLPFQTNLKTQSFAAGFREIFSNGTYPVPPDRPTPPPTPTPTPCVGSGCPVVTPTATPPAPTPPPACVPAACDDSAFLQNCFNTYHTSCSRCNNGTCVCSSCGGASN